MGRWSYNGGLYEVSGGLYEVSGGYRSVSFAGKRREPPDQCSHTRVATSGGESEARQLW